MKWLRERRQQTRLARERRAARTKGPAIGLAIDDPTPEACPDCPPPAKCPDCAAYRKAVVRLVLEREHLKGLLAKRMSEDPEFKAAVRRAQEVVNGG